MNSFYFFVVFEIENKMLKKVMRFFENIEYILCNTQQIFSVDKERILIV